MWGEFVNLVMNFLLDVIKLIKEKLNLPWIWNNPTTPPLPLPTFYIDTEYSVQSGTTGGGQSIIDRPHYHPPNNVPWSLIGVCTAGLQPLV